LFVLLLIITGVLEITLLVFTAGALNAIQAPPFGLTNTGHAGSKILASAMPSLSNNHPSVREYDTVVLPFRIP
jgi:hypothetical protein